MITVMKLRFSARLFIVKCICFPNKLASDWQFTLRPRNITNAYVYDFLHVFFKHDINHNIHIQVFSNLKNDVCVDQMSCTALDEYSDLWKKKLGLHYIIYFDRLFGVVHFHVNVQSIMHLSCVNLSWQLYWSRILSGSRPCWHVFCIKVI